MAVKRRPVVGAVLMKPSVAAAKWIVSMVSVDAQVGPCFRTPPMHFTSTVGTVVLPMRLPVMSESAGLRIV
jgi:hypothetical protein